MAEDHPFWCYPAKEIVYEKLDPGVREVVRFLVSHGFNTTDSGDGVHKKAFGLDPDEGGMFPFPHVVITVTNPAELQATCYDLMGVLKGAGIKVVSQTEAWAEIIEQNGGDVEECGDVPAEFKGKPKPYIEASFDPCNDFALVTLYHVTSNMIPAESGK